ncbi:unnamed protein product [Anisakis simplex]|uniref:Ig-like domain-containing protein n=1 Tax=Anisakis simplex TaxID=6269 RepID=A0A0M3K2N3_ANISI|nr:unnamed protein product [Anisakis simplex]
MPNFRAGMKSAQQALLGLWAILLCLLCNFPLFRSVLYIKAEIIWRLNDRAIVSDESVVLLNNNQTLWVNRASDKFGGRYTCHARNKVGYATRDFLVQLTAPPVLDSGSQHLDINVGDFTVLTCEIVSGTGTLSVKWLVDGKAVRNGPVSPTVTVRKEENECISVSVLFTDVCLTGQLVTFELSIFCGGTE